MAIDAANDQVQVLAGRTSATKQTPWRDTRLISIGICCLLVALTLACFARTLTSYFLADDFGVEGFARSILGGRWDRFFLNWTGNFNGIPGINVYRPWQIITWLSDLALWHGNAAGYYATNLIFYTGDAILLFFVCRQLTTSWTAWRSLLAGTVAAVLFVVNPLHCESVSWVVARVDIECLFYYLAGLLSYMQFHRTKKPLWLVLCAVGFWLGILEKEMAIGLPVMATMVSFFGLDDKEAPLSFKQRVQRAVKESAAIWVCTVLYFIIRFLCLGTLLGGYGGAVGDGQDNSIIRRWLDPETYERVLFPFAISLFPKENLWINILRGAYAVSGAVLIIKIFRREVPPSLAAFGLVWIATTLAPIYKLWGTGMDLEGSRFVFFLTSVSGAVAALLLLAPERDERAAGQSGKPDRSLTVVATAALLAASFALYKSCLRTNATWVHAGKEVRAVLQSAGELSKQAGSSEVLVLGIPKHNVAAHQLYNGATFRLGLQPPLAKTDLSKNFVTFDPLFYGPAEYINSSRLKSWLHTNNVRGPYVWTGEAHKFIDASFATPVAPGAPLPLKLSGQSNSVQVYADGHARAEFADGVYKFRDAVTGDGLQFNGLALDPRQYDFLQFEYRVSQNDGAPLTFQSKWTGTRSELPVGTGIAHNMSAGEELPDGFHRVRIPLSHFWRWYTDGTIKELALLLPPLRSIDVRNVILLSDTQIRPTLSAVDATEDGSGVFFLTATSKLRADASSIPSATQLQLECSKPDYFFDQLDWPTQSKGIFKSNTQQGKIFDGTLPSDLTTKNRYCELRVRALDAGGKPLGEYSDPLIINQSGS